MRKQTALCLVLATAILGMAYPAWSQTQTQQTPQTQTTPGTAAKVKKPTFDEQYRTCMAPNGCTTQQRLHLIEGMSAAIHWVTQNIDQRCLTLNRQDCVGMQPENTQQWHKMHNAMQNMMQLVENSHPAKPQMNMQKPPSQDMNN